MNNIKKFRVSFGYTQKELASMLKTTQQSLARWEKGESEPKQAILKSMALLFGTTIDDLLGENSINKTPVSNHYYIFGQDNGIDGYWGHIGILLKGQQKHQWFPITKQTSCDLYDLLQIYQVDCADQPFISIHTLNNRVLWLNLKKIAGISLLDDGADIQDDDWTLTWDNDQGYPGEVYNALDDSLYENSDDIAEPFRDIAERLIKENNFSEGDILEKVCNTDVYYSDGKVENISVDQKYLWDIEWHIIGGYAFNYAFLNLSSSDMDRFKNMDHIDFISAPQHLIRKEALIDMKE